MFLLKSISRLPLSVLYLLADLLFFVAYYIVRYRRTIVRKNLTASFPEKSSKERKLIEIKFYRNLADITIETFKLLTISEKELLRRVKIDNSLTISYFDNGWKAFGMTSHFCNWEWFLVACSNQLGLELHVAYQQLRNEFFDRMMIQIRSRFGVVPHDKNVLIRDLIRMKDKTYLMAMASDQRPYSGDNKYWSTFLNQDSAMYSGSEVLAKRMDIKVTYASMKRIKRGYYEVCFKEIEKDPVSSKPNEIIEKFIRLAEEDILSDPASYLWSHNRWKHKRPKE